MLAGPPAWAVLGGGESGITADQNAWRATRADTAMQAYTVHTVSTPFGLTVREYAGRSGVVFAVAWNGPVRADLQQLLGAYYAEYNAALLKIQPLGLHRSLHLETTNLHIDLGGHLRAYAGRIYVPALIPDGVSRDQLR